MKKNNVLNAKPTVLIGIPAFNESGNIIPLIKSLLIQKQDNFILENIFVISDGSTDGMVQAIRKIKSKFVIVKDHIKRKGKPTRLNELMEYVSSDILVLLDADVEIKNTHFLINLIEPMIKDKRVYLTSGTETALAPITFFENIIYTGLQLWEKAKQSKGMSKMYLCEGKVRALRLELYKKFQFPKASADDVYPYLVCVSKGYKFAHVKTAEVFFRLPQTFKDFMKQQARFLESENIQVANFGKDLINQHYTVTNSVKLKILAQSYFFNPFMISLYLVILIVPKILQILHLGDKRANWDVISSTKIVA